MEFSNVQDLSGPPLFESLFFVSPIPTALAAIVLGVILYEILRRRERRRAAFASLAAGVTLGGAILAIGALVETDHEVIRRETERFIELVTAGDRDRLEEIVSSRVALVIAAGETAKSADWFLDRVEDLGPEIVRNSTRWRGTEIRSPTTARGRITLHTEMAGSSGSTPSTWDFVWQRAEDGTWRVVKVEALSVMGRKPWRGLSTWTPDR